MAKPNAAADLSRAKKVTLEFALCRQALPAPRALGPHALAESPPRRCLFALCCAQRVPLPGRARFRLQMLLVPAGGATVEQLSRDLRAVAICRAGTTPNWRAESPGST